MEYPSAYEQDVLVRMAHHSTAIEGNTLTLYETKSILLDHFIPRPVDLREVYEVRNYGMLLPYLLEAEGPVTLDVIKTIHRLLMQDIDDRAGQFKTSQNMIVGARFIPTPPYMVPSELKNWMDTLQYRLDHAVSAEEKTEAIMDQHIRFERIHPFPDGNGRTGRALIIYSCLQEKLPLIVIEKEMRPQYMNFLDEGNSKALTELAMSLQKQETERLAAFTG